MLDRNQPKAATRPDDRRLCESLVWCAPVRRAQEAKTKHTCNVWWRPPGPCHPSWVHRPTMRIIDGFHRVSAALRKGLTDIEAYLLDGPAESAFIIAVRANVIHGLPLSLADRRAAAVKVLREYPRWSDRAVATTTGLSPQTVAMLRASNGQDNDFDKRLGKDGRLRPINAAAGRQLAAELLTLRPQRLAARDRQCGRYLTGYSARCA